MLVKNGLVSKTDASYAAMNENVCGVNPIIWNWNNEAVACDFKGNGLTNAKTAKCDCAAKCKATFDCTHYVW